MDNTLLEFEACQADLDDEMSPLIFQGYVSTDEKLRAEGAAVEEKYGAFQVEVYTRRDLYEAIRDGNGAGRSLSEGEQRLHQETVKDFELNGLKLEASKLSVIKEKLRRLSTLATQFQSNINADDTALEFTEKELEGTNEEFRARLKHLEGGRFRVTTQQPDYVEVMKSAKDPETRRKMMFAYNNRAAAANIPLLEEALLLRQEVAALMGDKNWVDYRLREGRMASGSKAILSFLQGLRTRLTEACRQDLARLGELKGEMDPSGGPLRAWDLTFYSDQLKRKKYTLDDEEIREYFPADRVTQGMFEVYSELLGVKFVEELGDRAQVWSPEVKLYRIVEAAGDGRAIGYFYTDFFPREGKFGHAAAFPLVSGRRRRDGSYSLPTAAIVANFSPPSAARPSLLTHSEVRTLFHEFGHIMHQTLTRAPYASLSGSSVPQDFVEAPSQMLENWIWSREILDRIAGHFHDPTRKLPEELFRKMLEAKKFNQGYHYTRQLMLALLDLEYHTTSGKVDTTEIQNRLHREILGMDPIEGGHFQAGFGHLMGGYDAGYYGYLWSEVYAADLFTRFEKEGLLNSQTGGDYRRAILESGNMRPCGDLLKQFLGREPEQEAFFRQLGA